MCIGLGNNAPVDYDDALRIQPDADAVPRQYAAHRIAISGYSNQAATRHPDRHLGTATEGYRHRQQLLVLPSLAHAHLGIFRMSDIARFQALGGQPDIHLGETAKALFGSG